MDSRRPLSPRQPYAKPTWPSQFAFIMRPSVARLRPIRFFKQPMVQRIVQCDVKTSCSINSYRFNINTNKKNDRHDHMPRAAFICICVSRSSSAISSLLPYASMTAFTHTAPDRGCNSNVMHCFLKAQQSTTRCVGYWHVKTRRQPTLSLVDLVDTLYQRLSLVDLVDTLYQQRHLVLHTYFTLTTTINCLVFMTLSSATTITTTITTTLCVA
jgi:hypothetical protein